MVAAGTATARAELRGGGVCTSTVAVGATVACIAAILFSVGSGSFRASAPSQHESPGVLARIEEADLLSTQGRYNKAIQAYISIIKGGGLQFPEVLIYNLGMALSAVGDHQKATVSFAQAADLIRKRKDKAGPDQERLKDAENRAGESAARIGSWDRAILHFRSAISQNQRDARLWFNLGASYMNKYNLQALDKDKQDPGVNRIDKSDRTQGDSRNDFLSEAVSAFRSAATLDPLNSHNAAYFGLALMLNGNAEEGDGVLQEWVKNEPHVIRGLHIHVGFRLGDIYPEIAIRHLEIAAKDVIDARKSRPDLSAGLEYTERDAVQTSSVFYRLGRAYRAKGLFDKEQECYQRAVKHGVWWSTEQRPGYLYPDRRLYSAPFPHTNQTLLRDPRFAAMWDVVKSLEANAERIREEYIMFMNNWRGTGTGEEFLLIEDNESIADQGAWHQLIFSRNGHPVPKVWSSETVKSVFPVTLSILSEMRKDVSSDLPKGSMEFSILSKQSHLRPHCGPSNHRIRLHLPIYLPKSPPAQIRVSNETLEWVEGQVLVLDDSYDHEVFPLSIIRLGTSSAIIDFFAQVWNDSDEERVVLLLDVWHPHLSHQDREKVRDHFNFWESSWRATRSPWGLGSI